jgi:hypothetical protein
MVEIELQHLAEQTRLFECMHTRNALPIYAAASLPLFGRSQPSLEHKNSGVVRTVCERLLGYYDAQPCPAAAHAASRAETRFKMLRA